MWEHSTHNRARGNFPVLTGKTMVVKIKENVQCRVVLIQTDKEKMSETNESSRGISKIIMFSGTTKRQAKTIWHDTAERLLQKDR